MPLTQVQIDTLNKVNDTILHGFVVSEVRQIISKKGNPLTLVTLVGKKRYTALPSSLYFGEMEFDKVKELEGQTVSFTFTVGTNGISITNLYAH